MLGGAMLALPLAGAAPRASAADLPPVAAAAGVGRAAEGVPVGACGLAGAAHRLIIAAPAGAKPAGVSCVHPGSVGSLGITVVAYRGVQCHRRVRVRDAEIRQVVVMTAAEPAVGQISLRRFPAGGADQDFRGAGDPV